MGKIGKREAMRAALANAAALVEAMDLSELFGDELFVRALECDGGEEVLTDAQAKAVARIRGLIKPQQA